MKNNPMIEADLIDFAIGYIVDQAKMFGDADDLAHDWAQSLKTMGVNQRLITAILLPQFIDLRLRRSASEWARDSISSEWDFLVTLDKKISKKKNLNLSARNISPAPGTTASSAIRPGSQGQFLTPTSNTPRIETSVAIPDPAPAYKMLYKGGFLARLDRVFLADGTIDLIAAYSTPPTDFSPRRADILYFTPSKLTAKNYALFAKARSPNQETGMLYLSVPSSELDAALRVYGDDWRRLVLLSRRQSQLTGDLLQYQDAPVLIGPMCGQTSANILRFSSSDEIEVMKEGQEKPDQVVWQGSDTIKDLSDRSRHLIWLENEEVPGIGKHIV